MICPSMSYVRRDAEYWEKWSDLACIYPMATEASKNINGTLSLSFIPPSHWFRIEVVRIKALDNFIDFSAVDGVSETRVLAKSAVWVSPSFLFFGEREEVEVGDVFFLAEAARALFPLPNPAEDRTSSLFGLWSFDFKDKRKTARAM